MPTDRPQLLLVTFSAMLFLAACSGSPPAKEPVATTVTPPVAPAPAASTSGTNTDPQKLTPERIMQLQHEGYTLVDRNGEPYFCRNEKKTGSRLARETICLTERQIVALREETQRGLARTMREIPPPQGK